VVAGRYGWVRAVVDAPRGLGALVGGRRLLLRHRGDRQHVVGRQVLGARVAEVDRPPVPPKSTQLGADELRRARTLGELIGRRKEEALERPASESGDQALLPRRPEVAGLGETGLAAALAGPRPGAGPDPHRQPEPLP